MGLISRQKLEKRVEKNGMFLLKNGKDWNVPNGKERSAQQADKATVDKKALSENVRK